MVATSSTVNAVLASLFGCTRNSSRTPLAVLLRKMMIGRKIRDRNTSGGARMSAARSGTENDTFFGTISPITTWRKETITRVTTNAMIVVTLSAHPVRWSGTESRWWIAGSDTLRISSEATVIPSWLVASIIVACSIAYSVVFAARLPASARGSICERRAEMIANSAATKNALTRSSSTSQAIPAQSLTSGHRLRGGPACNARGRSGGRP